jgi:hypothetical protein
MRDYFARAAGGAPPAPPLLPRPGRVLRFPDAYARLAARPHVFGVAGFLTDAECDHLVRLGAARCACAGPPPHVRAPDCANETARCELPPLCDATAGSLDAVVAAVERRLAACVGIEPHALQSGLTLTYTRPGARGPPGPNVGLHVDSNNGHPYRFCTAIAYLDGLGEGLGGETLFPVAESDEARTYAARALSHGATHTRAAPPRAKRAADRLLEFAMERCVERRDAGVCLPCDKGALAVFYSRDADGHPDPGAWHGGMAIHADAPGKWTLQKFFEVPPEFRPREDDHESIAAARLRDCCVRHVPGDLHGPS